MTKLAYNPEKLTVMIVDDHDPIRKAVRRILISQRFEKIIECFDGEDAIKMLDKKSVDLVICDIYMRNVSGFDVLQHVLNRQIGSDVPVIMVTGEGGKDDIVKASDMGAADYVLKPFQAEDLEKKIESTLTKYHSPTPIVRILRRAERQLLANDYEGAVDTYSNAIEIDPMCMRAIHGKAMTLDKMKRTDEARVLLEETLKVNQTYYRNFAALADIYLKMGGEYTQDAISCLRRELEINPKQPSRQIFAAKLLLKEGDPMGAMDRFREVLKEKPRHRPALMGMAHAYADSSNVDKALYYCKRVRRYHPEANKALELAVRIAMSAGVDKKAEHFLKDEKKANPKRYDTYLILAKFYVGQEREDDALSVIDELLNVDPDNLKALSFKGRLLLRKGEFEESAKILEIASELSPTRGLMVPYAEALLGKGSIVEALKVLSRLMLMAADHPQVVFLMAEASRKCNEWTKAYFLYRMAAKLGANQERCTAELGGCIGEINNRRRKRRISKAS